MLQMSTKLPGASSRSLVDAVLAGIEPECSQALKSIMKSKYSHKNNFGEYVFQKLESMDIWAAVVPLQIQLLRLVHIACYSKRAEEYHALVESYVMRGIVSENGTVRETARKLLGNRGFYTCTDGMEHKIDDEVRLLTVIEKLIETHRGNDSTVAVESMKPSPYKTMVLCWYDLMSSPRLQDKYDYFERIILLDLPVHRWNMGDDGGSPEEEYTFDDWRENYQEHTIKYDTDIAVEYCELLERRSIAQLIWALKSESLYDIAVFDKLLGCSQKNDILGLQTILAGLYADISMCQQDRSELVLSGNKLARAVQSLDNNQVWRENGGVFSKLFLSAIVYESTLAKPKLVDVELVAQGTEMAHIEIDILANVFADNDTKFQRSIGKKYAAEYPVVSYDNSCNIVHYMLDWIVQGEYKMILKRSPEVLAVACWMALADMQPAGRYYPEIPHIAVDELLNYAGVSRAVLNDVASRMVWVLHGNMTDTSILELGYDSLD
jgi:hypothetical protein